MKHQDRRLVVVVDANRIRSTFSAAGIAVSDEQATALAVHANLVLAKNEHMNLTAIRDAGAFVELHIVDSLAPLREVMDAPVGPMVDIGTGGGYPGIPLAIMTGRACALVEATRKKAVFLQEVVEAVGLTHTQVVNARAEEYARSGPGSFAMAVIRGVGELPVIVELAAPLLRRGGRLLAYKGRLSDEERERGARAAEMCGLAAVSERRYELPSGHCRVAMVYEKVGEPKVQLPRRTGMAAKRPLA